MIKNNIDILSHKLKFPEKVGKYKHELCGHLWKGIKGGCGYYQFRDNERCWFSWDSGKIIKWS